MEFLFQQNFDANLLLGLHQWANPLLDQIMLSITRLGNPEVVVVVVIISLGYLLWQRQRWAAMIQAIACTGALILNQGMKQIFARPRPELWTPLIHETSYGFPSGHALGTLVLYGFLAYLLAQRYPSRSLLIYGITAITVVLIGFSRLYLGVHYFSDVAAGFVVGFLWLMLCITLLNFRSQVTKFL